MHDRPLNPPDELKHTCKNEYDECERCRFDYEQDMKNDADDDDDMPAEDHNRG